MVFTLKSVSIKYQNILCENSFSVKMIKLSFHELNSFTNSTSSHLINQPEFDSLVCGLVDLGGKFCDSGSQLCIQDKVIGRG